MSKESTTPLIEPYQPPGYGGKTPHRGSLLISLAAAGALAGTVSIWGIFSTVFVCACLPGPVITCCFTVPAWLMASSDLDQMRRGKVDSSGQSVTRWALVLGVVGTLVGLGGFAAIVAIWLDLTGL